MKTILTAICISTCILSACANEKSNTYDTAPKEIESEKHKTGEFSHLKYYFDDASVAPEYHRSYEIEISNTGKASYFCHSYGDTLVYKSFKVKKGDLDEIQQAISSLGAFGGLKGLKFTAVSGTTGEGLDIFNLENKQTVDVYWNNTSSANVEEFVLLLKRITSKKVGKVGTAKYVLPFDKFIKTKGDYINLSHYSDFNQVTGEMILAIQEYLANDKENIFKKHFALKDYYTIDKVAPEKDGIIEIIIIHKDDFKIRWEDHEKGNEIDRGNNPSGYSGTVFYDFDAQKIRGMNGWE